ncbi:MAG: LLM class F420-dependent oxidoreductase [Actinobacteria bacterium]|uniref:Luciferase-like domain-containing protein n=1 Tax=marine metagenome TaxID=408172 RepID=A0A381MZK1_9ZZZZ|nr:LLM class F420-dependent oxidoreductase [Actinomycetota bacterium]MCS5687777.1 TIGR03560 family F420-dependent LLM class oxidoreductase [Acidimicrobiales bacterium]MEC8922216.1 TIGR03560 family F420-dependent LLM class oxidoreductase [Actinomycetota bacterium]MEC9316810.1 TIGR03560 family F420-dependent LLM class oxidoreductase [Actinomycetota bacterium]MED5551585.1 TIGR03560 family F420-dependent LLM class oxidoreductase [Actinomycetota bacterium]|tara:strand:+ start:3811 stop:4713 length:903 start_codon:yes stop_codon:yes gene_type:complete
MRFSFWTGNGQSWEDTLEGCHHAEATGWDGIWYADHFMPNEDNVDQPIHEAWSVLAAIAASVPRVRIGPLVAGNTYRNPALTAKIATTIDHISGGRVVLGIGAGWQENEHEKYGFDFSTLKGRLDRLDEAVEIITSLLANVRTEYQGTHYALIDAPLDPKPIQAKVPLLIGGGGRKRTLRTAARHADEWNYWGMPSDIEELCGVLDAHCEDVGRDPSSIQRSACALMFISEDEERLSRLRDQDFGRATIVGTPEEVIDIVGQYREVGLDELIVPDFTFGPMKRKKESMDLFIEQVAPEFR